MPERRGDGRVQRIVDAPGGRTPSGSVFPCRHDPIGRAGAWVTRGGTQLATTEAEGSVNFPQIC